MIFNKKNKILLAAMLAVLWLCYAFAIEKTIFYFNRYATLQDRMKAYSEHPEGIGALTAQERHLNQILGKYETNSSDYQNALLNKLNGQCLIRNLRIADFREPVRFKSGNIQKENYFFVVQGSYNNILKLLNYLENDTASGRVIHFGVQKKINYKNSSQYLTGEFILEVEKPIDGNRN